MKFGKLAPKEHPKTLSFESYLGAKLPKAPKKTYWSYKVKKWDMLGNDQKGDCVVAMAMHLDMNWTAHTGSMRKWTTDQAFEIYDRLSPSDTGLVMTDFLDFWQTEGMFGSKILGWVKFDHTDLARFKQVDWLFGGVAAGVQVPQSAVRQFEAGKTWTVARNSPLEGGHAIPGFNYGSKGCKFVTWAKLQPALNSWRMKYMDEGYGLISESWFDVTTGLSPNHFKRDALWADLKALRA